MKGELDLNGSQDVARLKSPIPTIGAPPGGRAKMLRFRVELFLLGLGVLPRIAAVFGSAGAHGVILINRDSGQF